MTALIRNKTTGKTRLIEANEVVLVPEVTHPRSVFDRFDESQPRLILLDM